MKSAKRYPLDGVLLSPIDERDYRYKDISKASKTKLPDEYNLATGFDVLDQGQINSCVGHSLEEWFELVFKTKFRFSPGFFYGNRSDIEDFPGEGMIISQALKHAIRDGAVPYDEFPYNLEVPVIIDMVKKDQSRLYSIASKYKALTRINLDREDIKEFIFNEGCPVIVSLAIYDNFYDTKKDGMIPLCKGKYVGRHCVIIPGWRKDGRLIVLNSWSKKWGDNGFGYLDMNDPLTLCEMWGMTPNKVTPPETPEVLWRVQTIAATKKENAEDSMKKLIHTPLTKVQIDKLGLKTGYLGACLMFIDNKWKVQVGSFKNKDNAYILKDVLVEMGYKDAFLSPYYPNKK